ncbi:endopeptidase [Aeromonas veronii]|uniref:DUF2514 domain-containing protein n=1 Tax=Aeromonas veronii TaxID=654 RepID=UPI001118F9CD|nr:DUF2514 domain-containing protein [Aeromonas veronii]TNI81199.1 endopeptidase [Aeromonas veronii]
MGIDALRRLIPILFGIALMLAIGVCGWWLHHSGYQSGADAKELEWSSKWNKQAEQQATAKAKATMEAREEELRRQASIDKVRDDAEKQIARAESDALAASDAADGVLEQAKRLAARAGNCPSNPSATKPGAPAEEPGVVLADVLGRADARAGELAAAYDRSRAAGLACERAYDALRAGRVEP